MSEWAYNTPHTYHTYHTAFERREGVGPELRGVAKRKMLGNIKFVGEWPYHKHSS